MSDNDNNYPVFTNSCINELDIDDEHKAQFKVLEQQFYDFSRFNFYDCLTNSYISAFNIVNDATESVLQFILRSSDMLYEIPSTIDQKMFNIRVIEYTIEFIRRYNAKLWHFGSGIFKTVNKFRVFNFNTFSMDKDTTKQLKEDRFKPFREAHAIKEPIMKCKNTIQNQLYEEYIKRALKRIEEKSIKQEENKN